MLCLRRRLSARVYQNLASPSTLEVLKAQNIPDGDEDDSAAVAFTSLRRAVPYISDHTLFRHVLLRRRWEKAEKCDAESLEKDSPIVCLRVKLPKHFVSIR